MTTTGDYWVTGDTSDLNPVACLILKVMLEDIPRHGPGLADELRMVGGKIKAAAEKELAGLYPSAPDGAMPIAYLWARTVRVWLRRGLPIGVPRTTCKDAEPPRNGGCGGCLAALLAVAAGGLFVLVLCSCARFRCTPASCSSSSGWALAGHHAQSLPRGVAVGGALVPTPAMAVTICSNDGHLSGRIGSPPSPHIRPPGRSRSGPSRSSISKRRSPSRRRGHRPRCASPHQRAGRRPRRTW